MSHCIIEALMELCTNNQMCLYHHYNVFFHHTHLYTHTHCAAALCKSLSCLPQNKQEHVVHGSTKEEGQSTIRQIRNLEYSTYPL